MILLSEDLRILREIGELFGVGNELTHMRHSTEVFHFPDKTVLASIKFKRCENKISATLFPGNVEPPLIPGNFGEVIDKLSRVTWLGHAIPCEINLSKGIIIAGNETLVRGTYAHLVENVMSLKYTASHQNGEEEYLISLFDIRRLTTTRGKLRKTRHVRRYYAMFRIWDDTELKIGKNRVEYALDDMVVRVEGKFVGEVGGRGIWGVANALQERLFSPALKIGVL